ncbi:MAG: transketolase C-terminal domain-containing protein [Polyangiaceae bacterium]
MRSTVIRTLSEHASAGADIHLLTADLGFRVLDPFRDTHPGRFTNVGVSEANMMSVAAGMALTGKRPFCYSMVPFVMMRAFEQFRLDVCGHRQPVAVIGVGGGLSYGHEGISHHATEDVAILRSLPGLQVLAPGDPHEAAAAVRMALAHDGPTFIRLGQNNDPAVHSAPIDGMGGPLHVSGASPDVVVFATGHILAAAREACERSAAATGVTPTLFSVPRLKPLDSAGISAIAADAKVVFTIEEHSSIGGLGTAIAEILFAQRWTGQFERISLPDAYCETHGSLTWLRARYGLDPASMSDRICGLAGRFAARPRPT